MKVLVVPTNRKETIADFLRRWESYSHWDKIIVIEDNPEKTMDLNVDHHFSWEEIKKNLGPESWIVSRRDSAIRCYGFLAAYHMNADYVFSLDDDCYPPQGSDSWVGNHLHYLDGMPRWTCSIPNERTRGLPYENLGQMKNVMFNMGLWQGYSDLDAVQTLSSDRLDPRLGQYKPPKGNRIIPKGQYFPFCGMNFSVKREAIPLCYFPLMGDQIEYHRFDDIWFGIIAKKICDHLDWHMSVGEPFVEHIKMSNKFSNLTREANGIAFNEQFWSIVDEAKLTASTPVECMKEMGVHLEETGITYCVRLGRAVQIWSGLFLTS